MITRFRRWLRGPLPPLEDVLLKACWERLTNDTIATYEWPDLHGSILGEVLTTFPGAELYFAPRLGVDYTAPRVVENPFEDTSRWTLTGDVMKRRLQPLSNFLKDVLEDADLTLTFRRDGHQEDNH
ncbi:hypothetical protein PBI_REDNO2_3 [Mycobacterium phage Redno2]|uniref:hypothetical protein n=1 Tax=Mycobacterium phage Redno2 TaxID=1340709 RepID=UPI000387AC2F|nr:hypothetical protein N860_gp003 [Mycobacterium phage Redno2]AGS82302.1 hypothetical protein PBI_REDNO2_3 [Mycobacterium phage Redno2]